MASPLTHVAVGYALFRIAIPFFRELTGTAKRLILFCGAVGAATVVDVDFALGMLRHDLSGYHNQQSHSLCATVVVGIGVGVLGRFMTGAGTKRWLAVGLVAALSHVLIDFLTIGRGVQLLWPLTENRFTSPVPLFYGLRWSEGVWSSSHLLTLANELPIVVALLWLLQQKISRQTVKHIGEG